MCLVFGGHFTKLPFAAVASDLQINKVKRIGKKKENIYGNNRKIKINQQNIIKTVLFISKIMDHRSKICSLFFRALNSLKCFLPQFSFH